MAVPHTRPLGITAHATDPRSSRHEPAFGTRAGPGAGRRLLELRLGEAGHDAVGFAVHVPHYLAGPSWRTRRARRLGRRRRRDRAEPAQRRPRRCGRREPAAGSPPRSTATDEASAVVEALERQYDTFIEGRQRPSLLATGLSELPVGRRDRRGVRGVPQGRQRRRAGLSRQRAPIRGPHPHGTAAASADRLTVPQSLASTSG